jgi:hypothetical protein
MKVSEVLGKRGSPDSSDKGDAPYDSSSYRSDVLSELKDIFLEVPGFDDDKADRLATAICGLAREEMEGEGDTMRSSPPEKPEKSSVALVLAGKPRR